MKNFVIAVSSLILFVACNKSRAPLMQAPPEKFESLELSAGETKKIEKPKVNVLIVVDNSGSMKPHQENFKKNMDMFARIFFANQRIDAKVGIVPVYDSKYLNDKRVYPRGGLRKMNPLGELVPLKNKDGSFLDSAPYITSKTPNAAEVLKATVEIGVQWGPEAEESFSPVIEIVKNEKLNSEKNGGFYDKDAHLFIIFLTDADDATPGYSPEEFYNFLVAAKSDEGTENGRERIHVAAAISKSERMSAPCADNGTGAVDRIPEFLAFSRGLRDEDANLCSQNFGKLFAEYAQSVADKVAQQRIRLGYLPDVNYSISYGLPGSSKEERVVIPQENYTFLPETTEIILPSNLGVNLIPGGEIFIEATPVQLRNFGNGRLNTL